MNEYVTCTIATTMMMLLFGNLGNFSKEYKYSRYIEEIGRSTLPIYAIHWCILFAPNLNQNMYTRILNEDYYRNLLGGLYRENPVKSRNYEAVKSSKKWENVGNSYIIPALLLYRYSYI